MPFLGMTAASRAEEPAAAPANTAPGSSDPPVVLGPATPLGQTSDGSALTLADLPGRALIVCFWASWCPYCRAELPVLERIQQAVSPEQLRVVLVNTESTADWRRVRRPLEGKLSGLLTHDPDARVRMAFASPESVPYTVVLDRSGRRHASLKGWSDDRIDWLIERANAAITATPS